jgi:hypothetical protein
MSETSTVNFRGNELTVTTSIATSDGGPITAVTLPEGKTLDSLTLDLGYARPKDLSDAIANMLRGQRNTGPISFEETS